MITSTTFDTAAPLTEADIDKMMDLAAALTASQPPAFYKSILFPVGSFAKIQLDTETVMLGNPVTWDEVTAQIPQAAPSNQMFGMPSFGITVVDLDHPSQLEQRRGIFLAYAQAVMQK